MLHGVNCVGLKAPTNGDICLNTHWPVIDWPRLGNVPGFHWRWTWVPWPRITLSELKKYLLIFSPSMGKCVCYIAVERVYICGFVSTYQRDICLNRLHTHQSGTDPGSVMSQVFADVELESPVGYIYKRVCVLTHRFSCQFWCLICLNYHAYRAFVNLALLDLLDVSRT